MPRVALYARNSSDNQRDASIEDQLRQCREYAVRQDRLLEQKYASSNLQDGSQGKWFGMESPGLTDVLVNGQKYQAPGLFKPADAPFKVRPRFQPYYELHGSSNWRSADNSALLILGGDKGKDIQKFSTELVSNGVRAPDPKRRARHGDRLWLW